MTIRDIIEELPGTPAREAAGEKASEGPPKLEVDLLRCLQDGAWTVSINDRSAPGACGGPYSIVKSWQMENPLAAALAAERERNESLDDENRRLNGLLRLCSDSCAYGVEWRAERERREAAERERDEAVGRAEKLQRALDLVAPMRCEECGPHVAIDEDGCCATCGADAIDTRESAPSAPTTATAASECCWSPDEDGNYCTTCGNTFVFIDAGPPENDVHFCCYCGGRLRGCEREREVTR